MTDWVDWADRYPTKDGLIFSTMAHPKIIMHSMECECWPWPGQTSGDPHFSFDPDNRACRQHIPLSRGAYSLASPGAPQSPNMNAGQVIQVELLGYAGEGWTVSENDNIRWMLAELRGEIGAPNRWPDFSPVFDGEAAYGSGGSRRMGWDEFCNFSGVLGHQHVP